MIKKTRIGFVAVTMSLILAVMVVFVSLAIVINYERSYNEAYNMLYAVANEPFFSDVPARPSTGNARAVKITCYFDESGNLVTSDYGDALLLQVFSDEKQLHDFVDSVIVGGKVVGNRVNGNFVYGNDGDYMYVVKVARAEGAVGIAVCNRSAENATLGRFAWVLSLLAVAALLVLFVVVWLLSYKIVKPVQTAFTKQKQFISDASHELKTPVTIIRANAEALQAECGTSEWSSNIVQQSERMTALIGEMLELTRLEEKPLGKADCDLSQIVESAVLEFEPVAYEGGKSFSCSVKEDISLYTSAEAVRRVVSLLCDNAVKYSKSFVSVSFTRMGRGAKFTVVNDGCQVPAEHKDKIFERFYREDTSRARETGGNGLGLSTVKGLCDACGWKISVDCAVGGDMSISVIM